MYELLCALESDRNTWHLWGRWLVAWHVRGMDVIVRSLVGSKDTTTGLPASINVCVCFFTSAHSFFSCILIIVEAFRLLRSPILKNAVV